MANPEKLPKSYLFWLGAAAMAPLLYWVCLRFLFPGYFFPFSPFHIDIYDYVGTREKAFLDLLMKYPRPVAYFAMKILGAGGIRGLLTGEIAVTLANVLLTIALARRVLNLRGVWQLLGAALYLLLLFAHPDFYFEHRHDLPADVSYLFLILALLAWLRGTGRMAAAACVLIVLSVFAKETYFASALCLVAGLTIASPCKRSRNLAFLAFIVAAQAVSISYTSHINSPFVNANADIHATYHISLQPGVLASTYWFYVSHLANAALAAIALFGLLAARKSRPQFVMLLAFTVAGLAAFVTHAVLPNHVYEEYAWAGAPLFLIPLLELCEAGMAARLAACALSIAAVISYSANYGTDVLKYMVEEDRKGIGMLKSLPSYRGLPRPSRVLVAGLEDAVIPWEVPNYVRTEFGSQVYWSILLPRDVDFRRVNPSVRYVRAGDVQLSDYDYVALYGDGDTLLRLRSVAKIPAAEQANVAALLIPGLAPLLAANSQGTPDSGLFLGCAERAVAWGFWKQAGECLEQARQTGAANDPSLARLDAAYRARPLQEPAAQSFATITARPQRITHTNAQGLGATEIFWQVPPGVAYEIHVNAPDGVLFAKGRGSGHQVTEQWVRDGTQFYLQDVSEGQPLTRKTTLAAVTVSVAH